MTKAKTSVESLAKDRAAAQAKYESALAEYHKYVASKEQGIKSPAAIKALDKLQDAEENLSYATADHEMAQERVGKVKETLPGLMQRIGEATGRTIGKVRPRTPETPADLIEARPSQTAKPRLNPIVLPEEVAPTPKPEVSSESAPLGREPGLKGSDYTEAGKGFTESGSSPGEEKSAPATPPAYELTPIGKSVKPAHVQDLIEQGLGNEPEAKLSSDPRKQVLLNADATPEQIKTILQRGSKYDPTSRVGLSKLAEHFGVDLGDSAIGRSAADIKAGTHIPPSEVLQRILNEGHSVADIAKAIAEGKHLPTD